MLRTWGVLATIWFLGMAQVAYGEEAPKGDSQVSVFVMDHAGASVELLVNAEKAATRVLHLAGVNVLWVNCGGLPVAQSDPRCRGNVLAGDFFLSLIPRAHSLPPDVFGISFLASDAGTYADVFLDPIRQLRDLNREVSLDAVLGVVMVHELGHLLLGTNSHSRDGIMQAHWQAEQLRRAASGRLRFTTRQMHQMGNRIGHVRKVSQQGTPDPVALIASQASPVLSAGQRSRGPKP